MSILNEIHFSTASYADGMSQIHSNSDSEIVRGVVFLGRISVHAGRGEACTLKVVSGFNWAYKVNEAFGETAFFGIAGIEGLPETETKAATIEADIRAAITLNGLTESLGATPLALHVRAADLVVAVP